jgi:hypothetical protein
MKNDYSLHDAELVAIAYNRELASVRLDFLKVNGATTQLNFANVQAMRIQDFVPQNVVSHVRLSVNADFVDNDLKKWIAWATSLSDAKNWWSDIAREKLFEAIKAGDEQLVVFEPSMGAEIAIIFKNDVLKMP